MIRSTTLKITCLLCLIIFGFQSLQSQVGVNTTSPEGILDVNSATAGIVLPRIALTSTNTALPVQNPQSGNLAVGTVIYNTATTSTGSNDVYPGIYVWTGSEWFNKFPKKEYKIYKQTSFFQPSSNNGFEDIPGLVGQTFTPKFSGTYKVEISVNYGSGYVVNRNSAIDIAAQTGDFTLELNGATFTIPAKAYSTLYNTNFYAIWEQTSIIEYVSLDAGIPYTFDLKFDQHFSEGFVNDGNSGRGKGYIGIPDHLPCSVEFTHIGE